MTDKDRDKKVSRRTLLLSGILASLGGVWAFKNRRKVRSLIKAPYTRFFDDRPNIILVLLDTLRADHLGCYGYKRGISPNIDAFAEQAIFFEQAYAPMATTVASHTSLFTGLYPLEHGILANSMHGV